MVARVASRIEPAPAILDAARRWLTPVRGALGSDFLSCYLTGSVLRLGFDPRKSRINLLIVTRSLGLDVLDRVANVWPEDQRQPPHFEPLFMSETQVRESLDAFPIEWIEIHEAHLLLEGQDVVGSLAVPRDNLRLQCEHELRVKALRLRHRYLANARQPERLEPELKAVASGFSALFRALLRLRGEEPPAETPRVIERVADLYQLDPQALIGAYLARHGERRMSSEETLALYRRFLGEVDRLVAAIDTLRVP
jgi:hypothetical protein